TVKSGGSAMIGGTGLSLSAIEKVMVQSAIGEEDEARKDQRSAEKDKLEIEERAISERRMSDHDLDVSEKVSAGLSIVSGVVSIAGAGATLGAGFNEDGFHGAEGVDKELKATQCPFEQARLTQL